MKAKRGIALVTAILICSLSSSFAADLNFRPGLWKMTMRTQGAGGPPQGRTTTKCFTRDQAKDLASKVPPSSNANGESCKRTEFKQTSDSLSWKVECTGQATISSEGALRFDSPEHYTGTQTVHMTYGGKTTDSSAQIQGQRIGDCPK
jgi:Protein of unknown function (DUF3617)